MHLSNSIKDTVVFYAIKKSGLNSKRGLIKNKYKQWAFDVCMSYFDDDTRLKLAKINEIIKTLPSNILAVQEIQNYERGIINATVGNTVRSVYYTGSFEDSSREYSQYFSPKPGTVKIDSGSEFHLRLKAIDLEMASCEEEIAELELSIRSLMNSVHTVEKLISIWPECKKLCPSISDVKPAEVPIFSIDKINEAINIK